MNANIISKVGALLLGFMLAMPANATLIQFQSNIDGSQASAGIGTGSTATGSGLITLDDVSNLMSWDISWSGLLGTFTLAHFHGPALSGQNAGVELTIPVFPPSDLSMGSATITALQAADLLNDLWYINIHSARDPGGEIRGQVIRQASSTVPEPSTMFLFVAGITGLALSRLRRKKK
ncbi:CHRD domain-containing protein [Neptunomonas qingdaonensis]|uniref:CHRD domain-containing protein n=1 Tax=Neptunomonas qingdaonensis TaxID=1045558 RepID=UPI0018DB7642|nr:CHRD domain-containing protein [Neptunomonas qingdaonensis]